MTIDVRLHFRKLSKLIAAESEVAGGTAHAATTGRLRELIIHRFLRPHLPKELEIRSGIIIDSLSNRSKQQDCIIVDARHPIISVGSDTEALVIAESVIATVEIKSFLSVSELATTLEPIAKTKSLHRNGEQRYKKGGLEMRFENPLPILTYIFAFNGANLETLMQELVRFTSEKSDGRLAPEATCVLDKGTLLRSSLIPTIDATKRVATMPEMTSVNFTATPLVKDALFAFYGRLKDDVIPLRMTNYNVDPYYDSGELE